MKLHPQFPDFEILKRRMGAGASSWTPVEASLDPLEIQHRELQEGKELSLEEVETSFGGLLTYNGEQVILYIKDTRKDRDTLQHDRENAPKFHVAECRTLDAMRNKNRFERYVVTNNTTGIFKVEATEQYTNHREELEVPLFVCKNCLKALNWKGCANSSTFRTKLRNEFSLEDFFAEYSTFFRSKPRFTDESAPKGGYAPNWSQISERYRSSQNWICEGCGVNLDAHRGLLHSHHKNGVISDNSPSNLKALCVVCHKQEPDHSRMHVSTSNRILIQGLRAKQGIRAPSF